MTALFSRHHPPSYFPSWWGGQAQACSIWSFAPFGCVRFLPAELIVLLLPALLGLQPERWAAPDRAPLRPSPGPLLEGHQSQPTAPSRLRAPPRPTGSSCPAAFCPWARWFFSSTSLYCLGGSRPSGLGLLPALHLPNLQLRLLWTLLYRRHPSQAGGELLPGATSAQRHASCPPRIGSSRGSGGICWRDLHGPLISASSPSPSFIQGRNWMRGDGDEKDRQTQREKKLGPGGPPTSDGA